MFIGNKKQFGVTLIELLLVLVALAGVAITAFVIYPTVKNKQLTREAGTQITLLASIAIENFVIKKNYTDFTNEFVIATGSLPEGLNNPTGTEITHLWAGAVEVSRWNQSPSFYSITYNSIPSAACVDLINQIEGQFGYIEVNTDVVKDTSVEPNLLTTTMIDSCNQQETADIMFVGN